MGSQTAESGQNVARNSGRLRDWTWMVVGVGLVLLKAQAISGLLHHRVWVIVILALGLASSVLRTRPLGVALTAGPLLAFALAPGSTALGIAVGIGAFGLLLAMFVAVGTVLMARQDHSRSLGGGSEQPTMTGCAPEPLTALRASQGSRKPSGDQR